MCPGEGLTLPRPDGAQSSELWGPYHRVATGHATDEGLRHAGASGGALSALLVDLLDSDAVDAVIHVAAADDVPFANQTVVSRTAEDVLTAAGSRYAPSSPLESVADLLDGSTRYAFCGKPCDVAALRGIAEFDERVAAQFTYVVSFFCAGVPSQQGTLEVLNALDVEPAEVATFRFRGNGWPGEARAVRHDGTSSAMTYHESWGKILSRHVQARCKICPDGVGAFADIVFADAWETNEDGYPLFEERDGESLIIARTRTGEIALERAVERGSISVDPLPIERIDAMQPGQVSKATTCAARLTGRAMALRSNPRYRGFGLIRKARRRSPAQIAREVVGTFRRGISGRLSE